MSDLADHLSIVHVGLTQRLADPDYNKIEAMAPYLNRLLLQIDAVRAYYDAVQFPVCYPEWEEKMLAYVEAIFSSPNPETVIHPDITPFRERLKAEYQT
jgi:hypothetical protein